MQIQNKKQNSKQLKVTEEELDKAESDFGGAKRRKKAPPARAPASFIFVVIGIVKRFLLNENGRESRREHSILERKRDGHTEGEFINFQERKKSGGRRLLGRDEDSSGDSWAGRRSAK